MSKALRFLLPAVLALLLVAQVRRSADLTRAQHLLWSVEQRTLAMVRAGNVEKPKLRAHVQALTDAQKLDWAEVAIPTLIGGQHLMLGEVALARYAYHSANQLESRPEILVNLGKVCYSQGASKRAVRYFAQAVLLDPRLFSEVPEPLRFEVSDALRSQDDSDGTDED
jgi:Tfp pilus assembly protein PilF